MTREEYRNDPMCPLSPNHVHHMLCVCKDPMEMRVHLIVDAARRLCKNYNEGKADISFDVDNLEELLVPQVDR